MRDPHIGAALRQTGGPQAESAKAADGTAFAPRWPQHHRRIRHTLTTCPEIECIRHLLPPGVIAAAELRAIEIGSGADRILVAQGSISDEQYVGALATSTGTGYTTLTHLPDTISAGSDDELVDAARTGVLWLTTSRHRVLVIAPRNISARHLVNSLRSWPHLSAEIYLTTSRRLLDFVKQRTARSIINYAIFELKNVRPEFSASTVRLRFTIFASLTVSLMAAAFISAPALVYVVIQIALAFIFLGWTALRLIGALTTGLIWHKAATIQDHELPTYSIIIALYHEATAVRGLVEAIKALDYPAEKLDVSLVLESDDHDTRRAISALHLSPSFTIVTAPEEGPKTKPKALNVALPFARGQYVAVFDAEDRPEPDQLRKAIHAFRAGSPKLACVQARLAIDNCRETWLTRMFTAEYAGLFDVFLPGIAAWRLPLPLGGSSNHFRTSILRQAGAWDPYNVTEDADLGMRLARLGYHTAVIDSTTFEEAPSRLMPWLKQRTRWFKGWMQTWLVHMRHPVRMWRELGPSGFLVFQLVVGGTILAAIVHGLFAVILGWQIGSGWLWAAKSDVGEILVAGLHATTLISGYAISGLLGFCGLAHRRKTQCAWALLLLPLYWLLLSIAAWRALFHLILEPYAWEKTEHNHARTMSVRMRRPQRDFTI